MSEAPALSVILVNYNGGELLLRSLRSLDKTAAGLEVETFVVDNGSTDGSLEAVRREFPAVQIIENGVNLGFAAAANNRAGLL
ncbi:MAG: glycosyltransferase [candidate division KSB1 bacterium]|nr:glycosyltransferase [candidate division KSB1 bacterium]